MEAFLVAKQSGVGIASPVVLDGGGKVRGGGACVLCTEVGGSGWPWFSLDSGRRGLFEPLFAAAAFAML